MASLKAIVREGGTLRPKLLNLHAGMCMLQLLFVSVDSNVKLNFTSEPVTRHQVNQQAGGLVCDRGSTTL